MHRSWGKDFLKNNAFQNTCMTINAALQLHGHEINNFDRLFLGHHCCLHSFSDQCTGKTKI